MQRGRLMKALLSALRTRPPFPPLSLSLSLSVSEVPQRAVFLPSVTVKEGFLQKHKAEGPQLLKRFAFKKRYFWLSSETLSYAKTPDWQVRPHTHTHTHAHTHAR